MSSEPTEMKMLVLKQKLESREFEIPLSEDPRLIWHMEDLVNYSARSPRGTAWKNALDRFQFYQDFREKLAGQLTRRKRSTWQKRFHINNFNTFIVKTVRELDQFAVALEKVTRKHAIGSTVTGSVKIVNGVVGLVGAVFAPFTAGTSLILSATTLAVGIGTGVSELVRKY